jgi:hypothetical protein
MGRPGGGDVRLASAWVPGLQLEVAQAEGTVARRRADMAMLRVSWRYADGA